MPDAESESAAQGSAFPGAKKLPLSPSDQLGIGLSRLSIKGVPGASVSGLCCHALGLGSPQMRDLCLFAGQYPVLGQMLKKGLCRTSLWGTFNSLWESHAGQEQLSLFLILFF